MIEINGKDIADIVIDNKNVTKIQDAITLDIMWQKVEPVTDYLYIENTYNGTNTVSVQQTLSGSPDSSVYATSLQYSKDKSNWTTITLSSTSYTISLNQGEKVYFRGNEGVFNYWYSAGAKKAITTISASQNHTVGGNINTLLDYTNPYGLTLPQGAFNSMFQSDTKLTSASDITLPTSYNGTVSTYCYLYMFKGCTTLTSVPQSLPVAIMTNSTDVYDGMFANTAITTAPALPSTQLGNNCYWSMFENCTALITAPALPATTMASSCYRNMFNGCTALVNAPALPATTLASYCYYNMFLGCTSITTAPVLPATTLAQSCYGSMFRGCTSLTSPPVLSATTLVQSCYSNMFRGCTSLNNITVYANDNSATNCINNWLYNVASSGTFYNNGSASYTYPSASGIPQGWQEVKPSPYEKYFYVENLDDGTGSISGKNTLTLKTYVNSGILNKTIEYSKDKISWITLNLSSVTPTTIEMNVGDKIYFRNTSGTWNTINSYTELYCYYDFSVGGDITSLLDYRIDNLQTLPNYCFRDFLSSSHLINSHNLILPSITSNSCYDSMFGGCSNLTTAPSLPATTLADSCYYHMFLGCSSLTTIPSLPATTLSYDCYEGMFSGCSSLTSVDLTATTLAGRSCQLMFEGCTGLRNATLRATTIVSGSCINMFLNCSSLNSITTYTSDVSANNCLQNWVQGVAATGTFYNLGGATYPTGTSGIPSGWTVVNS